MAELPDVQLNVQDHGLGTVPPSAGKTMALVGVCQAATVGSVKSAGTIGAAQAALGDGPLLDLAAQVIAVSGANVILVATNPSTFGEVDAALTLAGSGSGEVTAAEGPASEIKVKIGTGGALGAMTYQVSIGGGAYGPLITSAASPYTAPCPGQHFSLLAFADDTYVSGDVYTLATDGTTARTGTGVASSLDGSTHSPVDDYDIVIAITSSGERAEATFRWSLDGGRTFSGDVLVPSAGKYTIPGSGVVVSFSDDDYVAGDTYSGAATAPSSTSTEVQDAIVALRGNASEWGVVYVAGTPADAEDAATLAGVVGAQLGLAFTETRYVRGIVECPSTDDDEDASGAFADFSDERVGVAVAQEYLQSPLTGRVPRRSIGWGYIARLAATKLSTHPGQVAALNGGGKIPNVRQIAGFDGGRDEFATPALDAARFVTMRSFLGKRGYFITNGMMMAEPGSDFSEIQRCRVMDRACTLTRAALLDYVNLDVRINDEGHIDERDAQQIEKTVLSKLRAALVNDEQECSAVDVVLSRTDNLLATSTIHVDVSVRPFGYTKRIHATIGFVNPALAAG